jgi:hypothetical protein
MSTLKEIIYNLKNIKAGGKQSDDIVLSDEQYMFMVDQYRAKRIRQDIERGKKINPNLIQSLGFLTLIKTDETDMYEIGGCDIYKTDTVIPKAIETNTINLLTYVGPDSYGMPFQRTSAGKLIWDLQSRYSKSITKWFELMDRIYVASGRSYSGIYVDGIFESPYKVLEFTNQVDESDPFEFEYPISVTMLDDIYKLMSDLELRIQLMAPLDLTNDGNEQQQPRQ